jgi:hypothetical protein
MTTADIARIASAAQKAGISTLLELRIAGDLLHRGECTFISLSNAIGVSVEAIAHACARMNGGATKTVVCREAVGFSMASLTKDAERRFREIFPTPAQEPLRSKNLAR